MKNFLKKSFQVYDLAVILDGYLLQVKDMIAKVCSQLEDFNYEQQKVYVEYYEYGKFKFFTETGEILDYTIETSKMKIIDQMESFIYFLQCNNIKFEVEDIPDEIAYKISFVI